MAVTIQEKLVSQQVPAFKAERMVRSIWQGMLLIGLGLLLGAASLGTLWFLVVRLGQAPGVLSMGLVIGFAAFAVYFLVAGGNIMSGQALDATADSPIFGTLAKLIRLWKGGGNPA